MRSIEIGNPEITKVVEELTYSSDFDKINSFNTIKRIPSTMRLEHDWSDSYLHYCVGEWCAFSMMVLALPDFPPLAHQLAVLVGILTLFMLAIPWLRGSLQSKMVLAEEEFMVSSYRFKWSNIEKIYMIQTTSRKPKYGVRLILKDRTEVNIDLALRKPSFGEECFMFHYIYIFWKRGARLNEKS